MTSAKSIVFAALAVALVTFSGCEGIREHVRSKDFRDRSPAARDNMTPSPIANVVDMPGWTTDIDGALAFATENPQNTVLFIQQSGNPQTEAIKKVLTATDNEAAFNDKQRVTVNIESSPDVAARFGVRQTPAVVVVGPGGVPAAQKVGRITNAELKALLK